MKAARLSVLFMLCCAIIPLSGQPAPVTVTHGPILGRLGSTEIGVWARTSRPGTFRVRYGVDPKTLDALSAPGTTAIDHDNTGWVLVQGLTPNTKYYYQVVAGDTKPPVAPDGAFTTLPAAEAYRNAQHNPKGLFNFRFEFGTGNNQRPAGEGPWPPAFKTMLDTLQDKVYFHIQNGDFIYEEKRNFRVEEWLGQVGLAAPQAPRIVNLAPGIVGVWENYKLYLERGKALAAWHRNVPAFFTFDDHEILDNIDGTSVYGRRNRRSVFRDIGTQAWYDYLGWANPIPAGAIHFGQAQLKAGSDILTDPQTDFSTLAPGFQEPGQLHVHWGGIAAGVPERELAGLPGVEGDPNANVYQVLERLDAHRLRVRPAAKADGVASYSVARRSYYEQRVGNAHFFFLDTRSHRGVSDPTHADRPDLSMLGAPQKAWLLDAMKKSDAEFFFVVSQVTFMIPHVGGTPTAGAAERNAGAAPTHDEAWPGFANEREELVRFWDALGKPVMVLTGDIHNSFSIKITDRIWEFASGPHNSRNHRADAEANRPANGTFDYAGRKAEIRWSSYFLPDVPAELVRQPIYTVVQVNNVFENRLDAKTARWVAFPHPQVVVQFHDGLTGDLLYAESVVVKR
jgi:phosphodiesterase/alkaline phosphatase D-like protein